MAYERKDGNRWENMFVRNFFLAALLFISSHLYAVLKI